MPSLIQINKLLLWNIVARKERDREGQREKERVPEREGERMRET